MKFKHLLLGAGALLLAAQASAHNRWILPSHFSLSNDKGEWVMVDITASNETFNVDKPMGADRLEITGPDGKSIFPGSSYRGHRKSVVDLHLEKSGTYQLAMGGEPRYFTSYKRKGEDKEQWLRDANKANRKSMLPKGAHDVMTFESSSSVLTYITLNSPSQNFPVTNKGLEFVPVTHPSDVAQGEEAQFKFTFNGKAQAGVKVEVIREGVRYRNEPETLALVTDSQGQVNFTLAQAGRYILIADYEQDVSDYALADAIGGRVFLTFEAILD